MYYLRAGRSEQFTVLGLVDLPFFDPASSGSWFQATAVDLSGGDTLAIDVSPVTPVAPGTPQVIDLRVKIRLPFDAAPGIRDLSINNGENNAPPTILKSAVTVLPSAYVGAQIWFFTGYGSQVGTNPLQIATPGDYPGINITDGYDPQLLIPKQRAYDIRFAGNCVTPRIYMWDCKKDGLKEQPSMDPMITGVVPGEINANNKADLNVLNPPGGFSTEGDVAGYINKKDDGSWIEPENFMVNSLNVEQKRNLPAAWQQNAAAAIAPDEFQDGDYNIAPLGCTDPGKRVTSIAGPDYTTYRGVMGFPDTSGSLDPTLRKYRSGTAAAPGAGSEMIPRAFSNRKPYFYMATPHWFYSREKIASAINQVSNLIWTTSIFPTLNPGDYYNSFLMNAIQFLGLPLYYRTQNNDTSDPNWLLAQASPASKAFAPFARLTTNNGNMWYNNVGDEEYCRSVVYITIDPVECVLPGPRWGGGLTNENTYRRNSDSFTNDSKIRIWYQDLWPFQDMNYVTGTGNSPGVKHKLADPVLLLEAAVPRFDVKTSFTKWANNSPPFPPPGNEVGPENGSFPEWVMESTPFEWRLVCQSENIARSDEGEVGGAGGVFSSAPAAAFNAATTIYNEFRGMKCKLVVHAAYWQKNDMANPPIPALPDNIKLSTYTSRRPAVPPYDGNYWEPYEGREGTYICPSGYLEVVDDG